MEKAFTLLAIITMSFFLVGAGLNFIDNRVESKINELQLVGNYTVVYQ